MKCHNCDGFGLIKATKTSKRNNKQCPECNGYGYLKDPKPKNNKRYFSKISNNEKFCHRCTIGFNKPQYEYIPIKIGEYNYCEECAEKLKNNL